MKKLLFTAGTVAVLALASCSNDETVQESLVNSNEISFEVVTNNATRATTLWSSTNGLKQNFTVYAQLHGTTNPAYIDGETISYTAASGSTAASWSSLSTHYWPTGENESLDFFAASGKDGSSCAYAFDATNHYMTISDVVMPEASDSQDDIVYAVNGEQTKANGKVSLNFRHALAQLVFYAKTGSPNVFVRIDGVQLVNVKTTGSANFGIDGTSTQYIDPDVATATTGQSNTYQNNAVVWSLGDTKGKAILGDGTNGAASADLVYGADATLLESAAETGLASRSAVFVLPQDITTASDELPVGENKGAVAASSLENMYFLVKCAICNVTTTEGDDAYKPVDTDTWVYGNASTTKNILIPVKLFSKTKNANITKWEAGKKYIYTFIFGIKSDGTPGNGGLDPDNPNPDDPVLNPIEIDTDVDGGMSVDDFAPEYGVDQYMTYPDEEEATETTGNQGGTTDPSQTDPSGENS
jgi:hypothetical protein